MRRIEAQPKTKELRSANDRHGVGLRVEHPAIQRDHVVFAEDKVQVLQRLSQEETLRNQPKGSLDHTCCTSSCTAGTFWTSRMPQYPSPHLDCEQKKNTLVVLAVLLNRLHRLPRPVAIFLIVSQSARHYKILQSLTSKDKSMTQQLPGAKYSNVLQDCRCAPVGETGKDAN